MKFWLPAFGSLILSAATLHSQSLDTPFNPHASDRVVAVALQPDGDILTLGNFNLMNGLPRATVARLNPDGSLDPFFNPGGNGVLNSVAVQPDGKIVVGGSFTNLAGQACTNLGRLNANGTFDHSFSSSALGMVNCTLLQPDGRILVAGLFTNLDGQPCNRIGRVNSDGSFDTNFNASANNFVRALALQTDGRILVGGSFTNLDGSPVSSIGRLNTNGTLDGTFNSSATGSISQIIVQTNDLILVSGGFTTLAGTPRNYIGRLNNDGSLDSTFNPNPNNNVSCMALQANGKIIVGGTFTILGVTSRSRIARLNANGTVDATFNPVANTNVYSVALQPDGKVMVAGIFTNIAGVFRSYIARLTNNDVPTQSLSFDSSTVTWMRGGSSPEIASASFDYSINGTDWIYLSEGTRIPGGWQASGLTIPANASVRARGSFTTSANGAATSESLLQQIAGVPAITAQPADGESVTGSNFVFTAAVDGTPPLGYQWQFNGTNLSNGPRISGATNTSLVLSNLTSTNMGFYALVVTNSFGAVTSRLAALKVVAPNTNDNDTAFLGTFYTTAFQADGRRIYGGSFQNGALYGIERANYDGTVDPSLVERGANVYSLAVQTNGDIVVGGLFNLFGAQSAALTNLARVHPDGSLDASFTNSASGGVVNAVALQPDGKILLGGGFTLLGSQPHNFIGRLNANGTVDAGFNPAADSTINSIALQANGQIIIGGVFTNVNGVASRGLARLNTDGTLDPTFAFTTDGTVTCVAVQPDGKILAAGIFQFVNGEYWDNFMVRLNSDGSVDTTYNAAPGGTIYSIALQADGKAFLGGTFSTLNAASSSHYNFARLKNDGTTDPTFGGSASATVYSLGIQFDGGLLVAGTFGLLYDAWPTSYNTFGLGHYQNNEPVSNVVSYDGSTISWTRTGPAPECSWVQFDASPDGTNWSALGLATYTNNAWELAGVTVSPSSILRARGYVAGGYHNGSGWFVEARSGAPFFLMNPAGVTNVPVALDGWATGTPPISYQWLNNGVVVTNFPSTIVSGAQTRSLRLRNIPGGQVGHYQLVASNAFGSVTSSVAIVSVRNPLIDSQPVTITTNAGATVSFPVTAIGLGPLYYQWFDGTQPLTDGANVSGSTNTVLTLSNLTGADSGSYWLVVTNVYGGVSNLMATLTVLDASSTPPAIVSGSAAFDRLANGFGFDLTALADQTVVIETSTNLVDWQPILTNKMDSPPLHFTDPNAITNSKAFYRVRLQ